MKNQSIQVVKLVLGFLGGLALLGVFAFHVKLQLALDPSTQLILLTAALASFGVSTHGAYKMTPPGGGQ